MPEKKLDRRALRTKRLLLDGLTTLLLEKEVNQISVKELANYADINRGTFYLHYKDVYDMLSTVEAELFEEFKGILDMMMLECERANALDVLYAIFSFLLQNRKMTAALLGPHGDLRFVSSLKLLVRERIQLLWTKEQFDQKNFNYYFSFIVSGCIGLIETWVENQFDKSVEEMSSLSSQMILSGINAFS